MSKVNSTGKPDDKKRLSGGLKMLLELGPLVVFFFIYNRTDIYTASVVLVISVLAALLVTYVLTRHIPVMPLVTAALVTVFGLLTYYLHDPTFIKMKATIVYCLFGAALLGGLLFGKSLLAVVLDSAISVDEAGWRKLTLRWGVFFFFLALVNEAVWRTQSEQFWVNFKVFGFLPLTVAFALAQTPLILRHELKGDAARDPPEHI